MNDHHRNKIGDYLMAVAKVAEEMDYEDDEGLLRASVSATPPLHVRRTLDQYYFPTLEDTSARDRDQVVYRGTKKGRARIVMVDQLWLWIINDSEYNVKIKISNRVANYESIPLLPRSLGDGVGTSPIHPAFTRVYGCALSTKKSALYITSVGSYLGNREARTDELFSSHNHRSVFTCFLRPHQAP